MFILSPEQYLYYEEFSMSPGSKMRFYNVELVVVDKEVVPVVREGSTEYFSDG